MGLFALGLITGVVLMQLYDYFLDDKTDQPATNGDLKMQEHQKRVVDEKKARYDEAMRLNDFIAHNPLFEDIDKEEQERLKVQLDIMWQLVEILAQRIKAF
tara:strand:- start:428 stop:730 length:303 start_codon:yes stop_codon:yes gene_type:complete